MQQTFKKNKKIDQPVTICTTIGKIKISRDMDYCWSCGKMYGQNDNRLNINKNHKMTYDYMEQILYVSQALPSYRKAKELLFKLQGIDICATQLQTINNEIGKKVFENEVETAAKTYEEPEKMDEHIIERKRKEAVLYILMDGSAVNTRIQDKDGSTWKEMKLGLIFKDRDVLKNKSGNGIIITKEYVTYLGSVEEFKKQLFHTAIKAGYGTISKVVVIGDGARWIWNMCQEIFPDAIEILDFYHLAENVYEYGKAIFRGNIKKYTRWSKTMIHYIKTDQVDKAIKKIKYSREIPKEADNTVNLEGYLKNNKERINYLEFENNGYYIGSGMIESGNKLVVQKRMKQSGMRWSINGAQYMGVLRAKDESNKWDEVVRIIRGA